MIGRGKGATRKDTAISQEKLDAALALKKNKKQDEEQLRQVAEQELTGGVVSADDPEVIARKNRGAIPSGQLPTEMPTMGERPVAASQALINETVARKKSLTREDESVLDPSIPRDATREEIAEDINFDIKEGRINRDIGTRLGTIVTPEGLKEYFPIKQGEDNSDQEFVKDFVSSLGKANKGTDNIFGAMNLNIKDDTTPMTALEATDFLRREANDVNFVMRSPNKLNLSTNQTDPNAPLRGAAGSILGLAIMFEMLSSFDDQKYESGIPSERRFNNSQSRQELGKKVMRRFEQMTYPSADQDPTAFFGEIENTGYKYRLTDTEQDNAGQYFLQAFAESDSFPWLESRTIVDPDSGRKKIVFNQTRIGDVSLNKIRNGLKKALGYNDFLKPLRTTGTPYKAGSSMVSEANYFTRVTTKGLSNVNPVPAQEKVLSLLNDVAMVFDPASVIMGFGIKNSMSNTISKYMKQDMMTQIKLENKFLEDFEGRKEKEGLTPEQLEIRNSFGVIVKTFKEAADIKSRQVLRDIDNEKSKILNSSLVKLGKVVYTDSTIVSGTGRMFYINDEANPGFHKFARAILKGAMPTTLTKTSEVVNGNPTPTAVIDSAIKKAKLGLNEEGRKKINQSYTEEEHFMIVMARTLVTDADKIAKQGYVPLLEAFKNDYVRLSSLSEPLFNYVATNAPTLENASEDDMNVIAENLEVIPGLQLTPDLEAFVDDQGKNEFYFGLNNLVQLARYNKTAKGAQMNTRATGEVDGISNGATIQGFQMGVKEIIVRGGMLFKSEEEIGEDIRDFVFNYIKDLPEIHADNSNWQVWSTIFKKIEEAGKTKDLLKSPIMTSIFGLEPRFQTGAARKFIEDNANLFDDLEITDEEKFEELGQYFKEALTNALGGALEHAKMAKRIGRIFGFGNTIPELRGPRLDDSDDNSRFIGKFGGKRSVPTSAEVYTLPSGAETVITATRTVDDPQAAADSKKISPGEYTSPKPISKLMNQFAVSTTHIAESAMTTRGLTRFLENDKNAFVIQMYDGYISDVKGFVRLSEIMNEEFGNVMKQWELLTEEKRSLDNFLASLKEKTESDPEALLDLSPIGEYREFGNFLADESYRKAVVNVDILGYDKKEFQRASLEKQESYIKAKEEKKGIFDATKKTAAQARLIEEFKGGKRKLKAKDFYRIFMQVVDDLQIRKDHNKLIAKVKQRWEDMGVDINFDGGVPGDFSILDKTDNFV